VRESVAVNSSTALEDLIAGQRSSLVLIGGGGTGKSSIVQRAIDTAAAADLGTLLLKGQRLNHGEPYAALEDVLPLDLLERLLDTPSRFDKLAARHALVDGLNPGLLIVEAAQWIDSATITLLATIATGVTPDGFRMMIAHRPRTADQHLAALDEALTARNRPLVTSQLDEQDAAKEFANAAIGVLDEEKIDRLVAQTGGQPALIASVIAAAAQDSNAFAAWLEGAPCPAHLLESIRSRVGHLSAEARELVLTLSFGASPTSAELGELLQFDDPEAIAAAATELEDEGFLMDDGNDVIPLIADVATLLQPPIERRRHHRRFAEVLAGRGGSAVLRAEHLISADASPRELTQVCIEAADELMNDAPTLAMDWLDRAADLGVAPVDLAARRVMANVRDGKTVEALRVAEPLFRPGAEDRLLGLGQAALAFVQARRPLQAASVLSQIAPRLKGEPGHMAKLSAALCHLVGGRTGSGRAAFADDDRTITATDPAIEVLRLVGDSLVGVLDGKIDSAVARATEACELELAALSEQRLALTASATAPVVATYAADLDLASRLAKRAVATPAATEAQRRSRVLRSELIAVWQGQTDATTETDAKWDELGPSDRLLRCAALAGAARRSNNLGALRSLHEHIMEVMLHPPDLLSLPAYGELMVAAARLGAADRVQEARVSRDRFVQHLGRSQVVEVACCWIDLQVLVASEGASPDDLHNRLEALVGLTGSIGGLVEAMRTWCEVLDRTAEPADIETAGRTLQRVGYGWEATRLVGAAALRLDDGKAAKGLLATARELRASLPQAGAEAAPLSARLSSRELEVAELMVGGHTYKEIGGRLFISPKTVEHHVARIRQRLNVGSRAEMLDILRTELADT